MDVSQHLVERRELQCNAVARERENACRAIGTVHYVVFAVTFNVCGDEQIKEPRGTLATVRSEYLRRASIMQQLAEIAKRA